MGGGEGGEAGREGRLWWFYDVCGIACRDGTHSHILRQTTKTRKSQ